MLEQLPTDRVVRRQWSLSVLLHHRGLGRKLQSMLTLDHVLLAFGVALAAIIGLMSWETG